MDSLYQNNKLIPLKYDSKIFHSLKEYLNHLINKRQILVEYLKVNTNYESLHIYEAYNSERIFYSVLIDEYRSLKFVLRNNSLHLVSDSLESFEDSIFNLDEDTIECYSEFNYIPDSFRVFSKFKPETGEIIVTHIQMLD